MKVPCDSYVPGRVRTTALDKYPDLYLVWLYLDVSCEHLTLYMHNLSPDPFPFLCPRAHWTAPPSKSWPCPKPGCPPSFFSFVHSFNQRVLMLLPSRYCLNLFTSSLPTCAKTFHFFPLALLLCDPFSILQLEGSVQASSGNSL